MKALSSLLCTLLVLLCYTSAEAEDKVVVIPLLYGKSVTKISNVIKVAKIGGDFTDPVEAVGSISDASENNPYLVMIGPGVYTLTSNLILKPHISIAGAGEELTKLVGSFQDTISYGPTPGFNVVSGADYSLISDLTIENQGVLDTGGLIYSAGIYNNNCTVTVKDVTVIASGGAHTKGIYNYKSDVTLLNVTSSVLNGDNMSAIENRESIVSLNNSSVSAENGWRLIRVINSSQGSNVTVNNTTVTAMDVADGENHGVSTYNSSIHISSSNIKVSNGKNTRGVTGISSITSIASTAIETIGGQYSIGIDIRKNQSANLFNLNVMPKDGTIADYGIMNYDIDDTMILSSNIQGSSYFSDGNVMIAGSSMTGFIFCNQTSVCLNSYNGKGWELDSNCAEVPPPAP